MKAEIKIERDHLQQNFNWEKPPNCCNELTDALKKEFVFVSNITIFGLNQLYLMPMDSNIEIYRLKGIPIHYCPWCGEKIAVRKTYPINS